MENKDRIIEYPYCLDVAKYEKICAVGKGTFGEVYKAKCKKSGKMVALKKFLVDNANNFGVPITTLREIKLLSVLRHENIVTLIEICRNEVPVNGEQTTEFYLVLEYCEFDLSSILANKAIKLSLSDKKKIMKMMFNGLHFIHFNKIIHRDLKASNILINSDGVLKLADFGLARPIHTSPTDKILSEKRRYTNNVVTLWYRAPELLLGERIYGSAIDVWSSGCVMMELWTRSPFLPGQTEIKQIGLIIDLCGSVTPQVWPGVNKLELYKSLKLPRNVTCCLKDRIMPIVNNKEALDLIIKMFTLNPATRINCEDVLNHDFFWTPPFPSDSIKHVVAEASAHQKNVMQARELLAYSLASKNQSKKSETDNCVYRTRIF